MPVLFLGHGSPMNALVKNNFTEMLSQLALRIPKPQAILCISAHWETSGVWITHMQHPKTIHDFYGFPEELFKIQYPAPGSPEIADKIIATIRAPIVKADDDSWGFDHGSWSILRHMYPEAKIPLLQLSLDVNQSEDYHFKIGEQLRQLREEGILIVGSGNIVHNLRKINWDEKAKPFDWAVEFDSWVKTKLENKEFSELMNEYKNSEAGKLSVPTPEHFLPLLYVMGAVDPRDSLRFEFEGFQNASISMRSLSFS